MVVARLHCEAMPSLWARFVCQQDCIFLLLCLLAGMSAEAARVVAEGSFGASTTEGRIAYMRYVGQGHEIAVTLPAIAVE